MELIKTTVHIIMGLNEHTPLMIKDLKGKGIQNICVLDYNREDEGVQEGLVFFFTPNEVSEYIRLFEKAVFHKYIETIH
ncbi:hypothetical protein [Psychrobacillus sp.]|uniref:hypothetical protein n=1 Tax=Psychrobacillus sp. TaxID=1871623 RepID=UPI0028BEA732|nr:hypothetical protein [Psychrobacillus sp.]